MPAKLQSISSFALLRVPSCLRGEISDSGLAIPHLGNVKPPDQLQRRLGRANARHDDNGRDRHDCPVDVAGIENLRHGHEQPHHRYEQQRDRRGGTLEAPLLFFKKEKQIFKGK